MGRVVRFGCFGLIGIVVLLVAVALLAPKPPPPQPTISGQPASSATGAAPAVAQVGQTASLGGWEVTLLDFGLYERFATLPPLTAAQGKRMVADMRIKNLQTSTSNFTTNDFELEAADGRSFKPDGTTATIERGFVISQQVQPGLTTENRVVFDIDPAAQGLTLTALKLQFSVPNP